MLSVAVDKYVISTLAKCKFLRAGPALAQGNSSLQRTCRRAKCFSAGVWRPPQGESL